MACSSSVGARRRRAVDGCADPPRRRGAERTPQAIRCSGSMAFLVGGPIGAALVRWRPGPWDLRPWSARGDRRIVEGTKPTTRGGPMRALVVYESMYGNTHTIAEAVADGLRSAPEVDHV